MKQFNLFLVCGLLLTAMFLTTSCEDNNSPENPIDPPNPPSYVVDLDRDSLNFLYTGGSQTLMLSSNGSWAVSERPTWLTVLPPSGEGDETITVTASANEQPEIRSHTLTFTAGTEIATVEITQEGTPFIELNKTMLVFEAESGSQTINLSTNRNWTVSNTPNWLTVSPQSGERNETITVTATQNQSTTRSYTLTFTAGTQTATVEITQIGQGVIINGVVWAMRNVDMPGTFAEHPESRGMFYQQGRNIGWSSTNPLRNSNGGTAWNTSIPTGTTWTSTNDPCPQGWRVPTHAEIQTLGNTANVASVWASVNGVNGRTFTDRATNATIFLPAVGWRCNTFGVLFDAGDVGFYWSSTFTASSGFDLSFSMVGAGISSNSRAFGFSVRCVSE